MIAGMSDVTDIVPVTPSSGEVVADEVMYEPLTELENNFALAVVEFGGNVRKAWRFAAGENTSLFDLETPKLLLKKANVALRIKQLTDLSEEHSLISLGSHLIQLAELRDVALERGETKVALNAEIARGEAAGLYTKAVNKGKGQNQVGVTVVINNKNDLSI